MTDEEYAAEAEAYFDALDYSFDKWGDNAFERQFVETRALARASIVRRPWWRRVCAWFEASK